MKTFKNLFSFFNSVGKTKKRRTRYHRKSYDRKRSDKRRSKRVNKMRGG